MREHQLRAAHVVITGRWLRHIALCRDLFRRIIGMRKEIVRQKVLLRLPKTIKPQKRHDDTAHLRRSLDKLDTAWDGSPFKITLMENMLRKLQLKLGFEALRGSSAIRRFRLTVVDQDFQLIRSSWLLNVCFILAVEF
jgi:hypothetical protein